MGEMKMVWVINFSISISQILQSAEGFADVVPNHLR